MTVLRVLRVKVSFNRYNHLLNETSFKHSD